MIALSLYSFDRREEMRLLKKVLSDHLGVQDGAKILQTKTENAIQVEVLASEQGPENATKEFFNRLDRF